MKKQVEREIQIYHKNNEKNTRVLGQLKEQIAKVQLYTGEKRIIKRQQWRELNW